MDEAEEPSEEQTDELDDVAGSVGDDDDDEGDVELAPWSAVNPDPVATARRMHGKSGAMVAAGMFGLEYAMGLKPKPETVEVVEASSQPVDVDRDGISVVITDDTTVTAPALERHAPIGLGKKKRHR